MREIDISITKGSIESFAVTLKDGSPEVMATVALWTPNGKRISSYTIHTSEYCEHHFELPPEMIFPIQEIASRLETIVMSECNKALRLLPVYPQEEEENGSNP
jgi:hypothetical protein